MTSSRQPRRASARACLKAISGLSAHQDAGSSSMSEEVESEASDFVADQESSSSESLESGISEASDGSVNSESEKSVVRDKPAQKSSIFADHLVHKTANISLSDDTTSEKLPNYIRCPLVTYIRSCRGQKLGDARAISLKMFLLSLDSMKRSFQTLRHPFISSSSEKKKPFSIRQSAVFPSPGAWTPELMSRKEDDLPQPSMSPEILSGNKFVRKRRFEFDAENKLLYVGGAVTCISWCPPRLRCLMSTNKIETEPSYLAVACLSTPGTKTYYSDALKSESGIIQIWNCGVLGLTERSSSLEPSPHFMVSHNWGHIMDMCWIPVSPLTGINALRTKVVDGSCFVTSMGIIDRVLGHLAVACLDGYVRIFSIPFYSVDFNSSRCTQPTILHTLHHKCLLKLSISPQENPHWLGWPTCLHIRPEFPERLFVGYTSGYVAYYLLNSLNPLVFNTDELHLAPVQLSRLVKGPVNSMALHPLNGKMLTVQGFDRSMGIWNLEDSFCLTSESAELGWNILRGDYGHEFLWSKQALFITNVRQASFGSKFFPNNKVNPLMDWSKYNDSNENNVMDFLPHDPYESARYLIPLGLQCVPSMDFSESLNSLAVATDRGRIELVLHSLESRGKTSHRIRHLPEMRMSICQWIMEEKPKLSQTNKLNNEDLNHIYPNKNKSNKVNNQSHSINNNNSKDFEQSIYPDQSCVDCELDRSMCWHKLWTKYRIKILTKEDIPLSPVFDLVKSPLLGINKIRFNPQPSSSTWIVASNNLGFLQFICLEEIYCRELDLCQNQIPLANTSKLFKLRPKRYLTGRPPKHKKSMQNLIRRKKEFEKKKLKQQRNYVKYESCTDSSSTDPMLSDFNESNFSETRKLHEQLRRKQTNKQSRKKR